MADPGVAFRNHYLQVQALTPENPDISNAVINGNSSILDTLASGGLPLSLAIFFILLTIGIITLLITRVADINKILTVSFLALITSAIPYGTKLANEPTRLQSKAGPTEIPKNVIVKDVTPYAFLVTWETDDSNSGVIRLRTEPDTHAEQKVFPESNDGKTSQHSLHITSLSPNTMYYFEILSGADWYNQNGQPLQVKTPSP
jgi:hypothetical protein